MKKFLLPILLLIMTILIIAGFLYIVVMIKSEKIYSFEECKNAGWLMRGIYDRDDAVFPKECVLWGGKKFMYIESTVLDNQYDNQNNGLPSGNNITNTNEDYYRQIRKECESKGSVNCCLASVGVMEDGGYRLAEGEYKNECPEGFQVGAPMKCIDSYRWCEPIKE